jgi:RNA polymerase primary sigma factor
MAAIAAVGAAPTVRSQGRLRTKETIDVTSAGEALTSGGRYDRNAELRRMYQQLEAELKVAEGEGNERLARRLKTRMADAVGSEFFQLNQGLAYDIAKRFFAPGNANADDYLQDANLGLWQAFLRWDPSRTTFATFSRTFISGSTQRGVRAAEYSTISHSDFTARKHILDAIRELESRLGRQPTDDEVRAETGFTITLINRVRMGRSVSLDTPVGDGDATLGDLVAASASQEADLAGLDDEVWWNRVRQVTATLSPAELAVLTRRRDWDGGGKQPVVDVATLTGIGRGTVSRLESAAEKKVLQIGPVPEPLQ